MELVQNLFLLNYCLFGGLVFVDFFLGGGLGGINIFFVNITIKQTQIKVMDLSKKEPTRKEKSRNILPVIAFS